MHDDAGDLRFFVLLVEAGNLTAVARHLNVSAGASSRRLARMEERLGVRLVTRTSRRFDLTDEGQTFYERAAEIMIDIEAAEAEISANQKELRGVLRIGAPLELGRRRLADFVSEFADRFPKLRVHLLLSDEGLDVVNSRLDLAIRIGMPNETGVVATKIMSSERVICAAPAYLEKFGMPATPAELNRHRCICLMRGHELGMLDRWRLSREGEDQVVEVTPHLSTTSGEVVHDWALKGKGIVFKVLWDVGDDLQRGRLVRLLPEYQGETIGLFATMPSRRNVPLRVRTFLDNLRDFLAHRPSRH